MKLKSLVLTSPIIGALVACGGGNSTVTTDTPRSVDSVSVATASPISPITPRSVDSVSVATASPITPIAFKPVTVSSCDTSSFALLPLGDYALTTNIWDKGTITNFTECVSGSSVGTLINDTAVQTGVTAKLSWNWPADASPNIKAYPEILYRPGGKGLISIPFTDVAGLTVNHDVTISATGDYNYNVAYDIWVDSTATTDHWPHKAEIMIKVQQAWPDAPVVDTITINGNQYDVVVHPITSGYSTWKLLVFVSKTPLLKASIPLKPFIDYLVSNKHLLQSDYISTIEFGTELKRDSGIATINSYSVTR
jgi:hypothetical protein